jgi:hypothetical protein
MSNHTLTTARLDGSWYGWCECGARSEPCVHRWGAEDWNASHLDQVARARAHLRDRNPSLLDQYRWYRKRAEQASDSRERAMWQMLATGLEHRLGHPVEEQPLFEENA